MDLASGFVRARFSRGPGGLSKPRGRRREPDRAFVPRDRSGRPCLRGRRRRRVGRSSARPAGVTASARAGRESAGAIAGRRCVYLCAQGRGDGSRRHCSRSSNRPISRLRLEPGGFRFEASLVAGLQGRKIEPGKPILAPRSAHPRRWHYRHAADGARTVEVPQTGASSSRGLPAPPRRSWRRKRPRDDTELVR